MIDKQLVINYGKVEQQSVVPLIIKQEEWSLYTGKVTKQEVVKFVLGVIKKDSHEVSVNCGMAGKELIVAIYVYPIIREPDYALYTSYGELSERYVEDIEVEEELIQFRLSSLESTALPVKEFLSVEWVLSCLDGTGEEVEAPTLEVSGSNVSTGGVNVYGTAKISYVTEQHTYILTAPRRETALDNYYSGAVVGVVQGYPPVVHVLEMPPTVESFSADSSYSCGRRSSYEVIYDEDELGTPEASASNLITEIDYCTQRVIREYTE